MPTLVIFLEKDLKLAVAEDLEDVRTKIELQARSGRLLSLQRATPGGEIVCINPSAVAYLEAIDDAELT
jgi:hypothetical protein